MGAYKTLLLPHAPYCYRESAGSTMI
jgi:hypothetical protein